MSTKSATTWFEITTREKDVCLEFYSKCFGLALRTKDMGDFGQYPMFANATGPFAGLMHMNSDEWGDLPAHWMTYFRTEDIAASAQKVDAIGGSVKYGPFDMPDGGQIAICLDDQEAPFTLMQLGPQGDLYDNTGIDWVEYSAPDLGKAKAFYTSLFGWETETTNLGHEIGDYVMFHSGGDFHAGAMQAPSTEVPAHWLPYLVTSQIESTLEAITQYKGQLVVPVMAMEGVGHYAVATDPSGAAFGLHQPPRIDSVS